MKNKATQTTNTAKPKKVVQLSKEQLETIVGGPETSRGTKVDITP